MTGLLGGANYTMNQASYDLARLRTTQRSSTLHVLFVCTGNICRSPMAERLAAAHSAQFQIPDFRASSAGTRAVTAHPIHHDAAVVLEKLGGNVSNFAARQLTSKIASDADLVLTMTRAHRDTVLEFAPHKLHSTFTLSEAGQLASVSKAKYRRPRCPASHIGRASSGGYTRPDWSKGGVL